MAVKTRAAYLPLPQKQWVSRASVVLMAALAMMLLVMSKTNNPWAARLRMSVTDMVSPLLTFAASPMDAMHDAGAWVTDMARLHEENVMLKNQNIQLLQWQVAAKEMETENISLHHLLNVVEMQKNKYITVRMVSDTGGPYVRSALVGGGSASGIRKDEAVINENGLVGRVIDVGQSSARVLLLNDINSRIPVMGENAREKTILTGNNSDLPALAYLSADSKIQVGERLITSGDGGIFPAGIPVGVVSSIEKGKVSVQPFADVSQVGYVSVVDYSF